MTKNGQCFSIFSNLWFYIGSGNSHLDSENITRIKNIYGINKLLNLDSKTGFWPDTLAKYNQYDPTIIAQLQIRNNDRLIAIYKTISQYINNIISNPTTIHNNGKTIDNIVLIHTSDTNNTECLIGLYIYFLCKYSNVDVKTATEILRTKIHMNTHTNIHMTDDMKKFLIINCSNK